MNTIEIYIILVYKNSKTVGHSLNDTYASGINQTFKIVWSIWIGQVLKTGHIILLIILHGQY